MWAFALHYWILQKLKIVQHEPQMAWTKLEVPFLGQSWFLATLVGTELGPSLSPPREGARLGGSLCGQTGPLRIVKDREGPLRIV